MLSVEKIASIISVFNKLLLNYTLGENSTELRLYKASIDRMKSEVNSNKLARYIRQSLLKDNNRVVEQYTFNTNNTSKFFDTFGEMNDTTTVHISIIDIPQLSRGLDNYYCCSKDNKNIFIGIPIRMLDLSDKSSRESLNYFVNLICRICDDYYVPELAAYIFAKKMYTVDVLVDELYSSSHVMKPLENYVDNEIQDLLIGSYDKIITEELTKLQSGDITMWTYLEKCDINMHFGLNDPIRISNYRYDESQDKWILV